MKLTLILPVLLLIFAGHSNSQINANWISQFEYPRAFIENKGQFDGRNWNEELNIEYGIDYNGFSMFFNKQGYTYRLDKFIRNRKESGRDFNTEQKTDEKGRSKWTNISELINTTWLGSNKYVEIEAEKPADYYFTYTYRKRNSKEYINENHLDGFKRIVYKNLYPNVDVDYEVHEGKGIKYNIFLHPGADPSKIKMKYESFHTKAKSEYVEFSIGPSGNFKIQTSLGEITELKPYAYYKDSGKEIKVNFKFAKNTLSFEFENYDQSKEVIIDPWVINATFNSSTAVWEVETDGSGNVYVIGGETPMTLQKYTSAGSLVWTHPTPWDTASVWLGTLATDDVGTSFITSGSTPEMQRVDSTGATVWTQTGPTGMGGEAEWWSITFNCDKTKLIVGGTTLLPLQSIAYATIFDMDINSGNVNTTQYLDTADLSGFGSSPIEVRSISSSKNAKYIFLTHKEVGAINQNSGACPTNEPIYHLDNGHNLGYKCENYLPASQNGGGLKAIVANDQFFYTSSGAQIFKRSLGNGVLISTATIPGGANFNDFFGNKVVENSGLAVDSCGNVYAGSKGKVIKFDKDLNILSQATVSFTVYDVSVNSNGEVIAVGAQNDNSATSRNGRIEAISMNACTQYELTCCNASFCYDNEKICKDDSIVIFTPFVSGGIWNGDGIIDSLNGIFDPGITGTGHTIITYTLSCGNDSMELVVNSCLPLTVCDNSNGNFTVTDGTSPYYWYYWSTGSSYPITNQAECVSCGYTWFLNSCMDNSLPMDSCIIPSGWMPFDTGSTVTPPGFPIYVIDYYGDSLLIDSNTTFPVCNSCGPVLTTSITPAECGQSNGTATVFVNGGNSPYSYLWNNGSNSPTATGLASGTFTVTVMESGSGCYTVASVMIPYSTSVSVYVTQTPDSGSNNGTAFAYILSGTSPFTYQWSDPDSQNTPTATGLAAGIYFVTVTDSANCSAVDSIEVPLYTNTITIYNRNNPVYFYPNPASESITIVLSEGINLPQIIVVRDVTGKYIFSTLTESSKFRIDVSVLSNGIYFIDLPGNKIYQNKIQFIKN